MLVLDSVFSNVLKHEFSDRVSKDSVHNFDLPTQPILKEAIRIKVDSTEKVLSSNDIVTLLPHKECEEIDSDQECELIGKDNIVVTELEASSKTTTITDIVVYDRHQNDIDILMTAVYPTFYSISMTSERSHKKIETKFLRPDWIILQLFHFQKKRLHN